MLKFAITGLALLGLGCATAQKDYAYMSGKDYQNKPKLSTGLMGPGDNLSEAAIQKILTSRVSMPKSINLAVVRLSEASDGLEFQTIDQTIAEQFYSKVNWGARVQSIIPMPQVMIAKPVTLVSLRQAAALLQADALVIIKPVSYGDWKFEAFEASKGKGVTSIEVLLLDTRTSVVPFTLLITETAEVAKEASDYSQFELTARAKKASEAKALLQVAPAIQKFMTKVM